MITDKQVYFRQKAIDQQNRIVNVKSSTTITSEALVWTYRTTNCDVISLITTAIPVKDGTMKDIRIESFEPKRLKPPSMKKGGKGSVLSHSPYDIGLSVDIEKKRKKLNQLLHEEKREFMSKLNITRLVRSKLENDAAKRIQALFRGYLVRNNLGELKYYSGIHKLIRANVRSYLVNSKYSTVSLGEYKAERQRLRNDSAAFIQCTFLRYLSRKCYRRKTYEVKLMQRHKAAVKIQSVVRGIHARARVIVLLEKKHMVLCMQSALKIQTAVRAMYARRRVHRRRFKLRWLACRNIQNWYRALYSKRMTAHIKNVMFHRKTNTAAKNIQKHIRAFVAKRRVNRIRLRGLHKFIFVTVTRIQCLIRKFLAKVTVRRRRESKQYKEQEEAKQAAIQSQKDEEAQIQKDNQALLDETDLFTQAKKGNTVGVEDIFKGLVGEPHSPNETNIHGDTLLTVAAATGNADLVRKCILWEFDINHRNDIGQTAVMIAAKNNYLQVVQYLLGFYHPPVVHTDGEADADLDFTDPKALQLPAEDVGYLFVASIANATSTDMTMLQALINLGLDINAKSLGTGMTAVHAACEMGHVDAFKLLLKNKARLDEKDDLQQSPLHKAVCASLKITEWILGLDPNVHTYMTDSTRVESILALDVDNKNCLLHAAVSGQSDILELLENIISSAPAEAKMKKAGGSGDEEGVLSSESAANATSEDIGWSPLDINKAIHLVETGNLFCIRKLLQIGFDPAWPQEDTNLTMALKACQVGDLDVIDLLMEHSTDFSSVDAQGRNIMHFAAMCKEHAVIPHLLSHSCAHKCKVSKDMLVQVDTERGENPYHFAVRENIEINVDLLATNEIVMKALSTQNKDGLTPFLLACSLYQEKIAQLYMKLGCDVLAVDRAGHGCLWHLFHPHASILAKRRVYCSEVQTQNSSIVASGNNASRREKDEELQRNTVEAGFVVALMKLGCRLYSDYSRTPEQIKALPYDATVLPTASESTTSEPGDVIVQEYCMTLLKSMIPSVLSNRDAWRLLIASVRFDDGNLKVFQHLLRLGILDIVMPSEGESQVGEESSIEVAASVAPKNRKVSRQSSMTANMSTLTRTNSNLGQTEVQIPERLSEVYFLDVNLVGWTIRLNSIKALQYFVKKNYNINASIDSWGNPCLHYIAVYGSPEMVDVLIGDKRLRWELENIKGQTAGMLAAKHGNQKVAKKLFENKASARRSLDGKYAAWVLAFARRSERFEMNLQTGRIGNDDDLYFNISPDPYYMMWYP